jgi:surfactin synthase thioesterase subunit
MKSSPWLVRQAQPQARSRLFCFSYAGGSAANYRLWQSELGASIEVCAVQLPGRGSRFGEAPVVDMQQLVHAIATVVAQCNDGLPFSFFGHSLGSLLAFEVVCYCNKHRLPMPDHLFAAGCAAPQMRDESRQLHTLNDRDFLVALGEYNGTSPDVLAAQELMQVLLPMIRADFALAEKYAYSGWASLGIPITVLAGTHDELVTVAQAEAWELETPQCRVQWFDGDHFFVEPYRKAICEIVRHELLPVVDA